MVESHRTAGGMIARASWFLLNGEEEESPLTPIIGDNWKMGAPPMRSLDMKVSSGKGPDYRFQISPHFDSEYSRAYCRVKPPESPVWRTMRARCVGRVMEFVGDALDRLRGIEGG